MTNKKILIIDDDVDICLLLQKFLERKGFKVDVSFTAQDGLGIVKRKNIDLVLTDFRLPDMDGSEVVRSIKALKHQLPIIVITGYSDVKQAVKVIQLGAFEYVTKPIFPEEIVLLINKALNKTEAHSEPKEVSHQEPKFSGNSFGKKPNFIVGKSLAAQNIEASLKLVAPTEMTVVILGESGTGKEVMARRIHHLSKRKTGPFVAVDCGALPKELAASELFGHVKGAFTGAIGDKKGHFELANSGTLFLDEIGNLSYENQIKLLRVLQERVIRRVGDEKDIPVDVRIIVATNEDLSEAMRKGRFREDIFYRVNEFKIELLPLRENTEDLELYAIHFLDVASGELDKKVGSFSKEVMSALKSYNWPGNIRELRNMIKRAVLLCDGNEIQLNHIPWEVKANKNQVPLRSSSSDSELQDFQSTATSTKDETSIEPLSEVVERVERKAILNALQQTGNNKSKAAKLLGIERKTLYNKMDALSIEK